MEISSRSATVRTTIIEAELSEHEVQEAIAAFVIARKGDKELPFPGAPGVSWQVSINDRTGEASATIRHEKQIDG